MEIAKHMRQFKWRLSPRPLTWEEEVLFFDSDAYFADLQLGIENAHTSIQIETYIFDRGQLADRISGSLVAAVARGVQVKLLVDGVGSPAFWRDYGAQMQTRGVQVRLYRAWPWEFQGRRISWPKRVREFFSRWYNVNKGNHRKTCLIDGQRAWISSCNITDRHLASISGVQAWVDAGVRVQGPELRHLDRAFSVAFKGNLLQSPFQPKDSLLFLNSSFLLRRTQQHDQLRRLRHARNKVWLQTPYFVPIRPIYNRLLRLARKGVDVRLMVPAINDVPWIRYMSHAFFSRMLKAGIRIYEYQPRFMHQKITMVDDWATMGSSNLNHRSFFHDLEVNVVISHPENRERLKEKFLSEQQDSVPLEVDDLYRLLNWRQRLFGRILLLLRYWA